MIFFCKILLAVVIIGIVANQSATASPPKIESIAPSSGSLGNKITLYGSGFTDNNDIAVTHKKIYFRGENTGYINNVNSPDGKTLRFVLSDLSVCAYSRGTNEICPEIAILLPVGKIKISVVNKYGTSNSVDFVVVPERKNETSKPFGRGRKDFCGKSTFAPCGNSSDCKISGCSGQICQSRYEEDIITTCEWSDCYARHNVECACVNQKCQWLKKISESQKKG